MRSCECDTSFTTYLGTSLENLPLLVSFLIKFFVQIKVNINCAQILLLEKCACEIICSSAGLSSHPLQGVEDLGEKNKWPDLSILKHNFHFSLTQCPFSSRQCNYPPSGRLSSTEEAL